jgi:hypothetical protein
MMSTFLWKYHIQKATVFYILVGCYITPIISRCKWMKIFWILKFKTDSLLRHQYAKVYRYFINSVQLVRMIWNVCSTEKKTSAKTTVLKSNATYDISRLSFTVITRVWSDNFSNTINSLGIQILKPIFGWGIKQHKTTAFSFFVPFSHEMKQSTSRLPFIDKHDIKWLQNTDGKITTGT